MGRDAEQIAAARYGIATRGDLLRWARRDAESFLSEHPLPDEPLPTPDLTPYLTALAEAQRPAEASAVTRHLLDAAEPVLRAVSDYLLAAAQWRGQNRGAKLDSPPKMLMTAAGHSLSVLGLADAADLAALRAAYDPAPSPDTPAHDRPRAASDLPPAPPKSPPAGPAPSR
ncbi:hypothetical protein ACFVSQ_15875 [Streptomyces niveus]|uniref:hypothetical protein n=1 Tax=Streptomyces niveus TaxID=193462 RepID=UPI0036E3907A